MYLTGDGICVEVCPDVFMMHTDGLAYVKEVTWKNLQGGNTGDEPSYKMANGMAEIPENILDAVVEAAEACPGECIFIDVQP